MAIATPCQTSGAEFITEIDSDRVRVEVIVPFDLNLTEAEAEVLEINLHNALELVLAPHFKNRS